MTKFAFLLVLLSLFTHAYWNFLLKDANNKQIFIALSKIAEVAIFAIPALYFLVGTELNLYLIGLVIGGAMITFLNYIFLSNAYQHGTLSMAYPISRSGVLFLPFLSWLIIDEKIDFLGWTSVACILLGTLIMHLHSFTAQSWRGLTKSLSNPSTGYSLLAALMVACYTLWGKIAVERMEPFLYLYLYTVIIALMYSTIIVLKFKKVEIINEWKVYKWNIIKVGFFNSLSYLLALVALTMSKATYVGGLRQLSIVVGVFFGYRFLEERIQLPIIVGILLSLVGGILIYFAK